MRETVNVFAVTSAGDPGRDWRVTMALASTALWIGMGTSYIVLEIGWQAFLGQPVDALGGFLEGAFAPLAFLWLVVGSFIQQRELRQNNIAIQAQYEEMRRTAENSEIQARAIEANAAHQQQETTLMIADRVQRQIGTTMGMLWMSSQASTAATTNVDQVGSLWNQHGAGDPESFARALMVLYYGSEDEDAAREIFFGTEVRRRHTATIRVAFEHLIELILRCDPDGIIEDAFRGGAIGRIYELIGELAVEGPNPA